MTFEEKVRSILKENTGLTFKKKDSIYALTCHQSLGMSGSLCFKIFFSFMVLYLKNKF